MEGNDYESSRGQPGHIEDIQTVKKGVNSPKMPQGYTAPA